MRAQGQWAEWEVVLCDVTLQRDKYRAGVCRITRRQERPVLFANTRNKALFLYCTEVIRCAFSAVSELLFWLLETFEHLNTPPFHPPLVKHL